MNYLNNKILCLFALAFASFSGALQAEGISSPTTSYRVERELGEGMFGKVYAVVDSEGNRYAMKCYKEQKSDDIGWNMLGDMEREFERGQRFDHPRILKSHELFHSDDRHFLVLEYVDGKTLKATPRRSLGKEQALAAAHQLLDAFRYTYEMGYLFMDMHGGNIMLEQTGAVKMIDLAGFFSWEELVKVFGLADPKGVKPRQLEEKIHRAFPPKRAEILKRFIEENPGFAKKFQQVIRCKGLKKQDLVEFLKEDFSPIYFDKYVTEGVIKVLQLSDMEKKEKVEKRAAIKKIASGYVEDAADGIPSYPSITERFDELNLILN